MTHKIIVEVTVTGTLEDVKFCARYLQYLIAPVRNVKQVLNLKIVEDTK